MRLEAATERKTALHANVEHKEREVDIKASSSRDKSGITTLVFGITNRSSQLEAPWVDGEKCRNLKRTRVERRRK